jgi:hypothetical protein
MERRIPFLIGASLIAIVVIVSAYLISHPAETNVRVPVMTAAALASPPAATPVPVPVAMPPAAAKTTAQWIADTSSGDAATRATAIAALAEAPRAEALPVLGRILTDGEPLVDRSLALRSLRDLALNQGDPDGAIRDAVRHAIYHGDDLTRVADVQEVLDIIEESQQGR